jgi:diguanylate cyclase (GGDEF)-like protein
LETLNCHNTSLLLTGSDTATANRLVSELRRAGIAPRAACARSGAELSALLSTASWDVLVCYDSGIPEAGNVLEILKQHETELPVLVVAVEDKAYEPARLLQEGVADYLGPADGPRLVNAIKRESACHRMQRSRAAALLQLDESNRQFLALLDESPLAYAFLQDGTHLYCNSSYAAIFDYPDPAGIMTRPLLDLVAAGDRQKLREFLMAGVKNPASIPLTGMQENGACLPLEFRFAAATFNGLPCLQLRVGAGRGNTSWQDKVRQLATRDLLTRLENTHSFSARIEQAIHKAVVNRNFSAVLVVELNEFLDLGSAIGKANANLVLNDIAHWLQQKIRMPYAAARLDRHVFGLLLYESNPARTIALAQEIRSQISSRISAPLPDSLSLTCSIGLAIINDESQDAASVLARARSRVRDFRHQSSPSSSLPMNEDVVRNVPETLQYLEFLLRENRIRLAFQPVVPIRAGMLLGYEVLGRIPEKDGQATGPGGYLWLANLNGLGEKLDRLVTASALARLPDLDSRLALVIKVSHNSLTSLTFLPWMSEQLALRRISSERLVIEISEIDFHSAPGPGLAFCRGLHELGLRISICHFGCAVDPFGVLDEIRPAFAKFDVTLVRDIIYSMQQKHNLATMIKALHDRKVLAIVPGVEDGDALPVLWEIGADHAQGYCLQAPGNAMDYEFVAEQEITLKATPQ